MFAFCERKSQYKIKAMYMLRNSNNLLLYSGKDVHYTVYVQLKKGKIEYIKYQSMKRNYI